MYYTFFPSSTENLCSKGSRSFKSLGGGSLRSCFAHLSRVYLLTARYSRIVVGSLSVSKQQYRPSDVNLVKRCRTVRKVRVLSNINQKFIASIIKPVNERVKFKNWFMLSVRISSYGCTREVWRAREKRKSCSRR